MFTLKSLGIVTALVSSLFLVGCSTPTDTGNAGVKQDVQVAQTNYRPYSASAVKTAVAEGKKTAVFFHGATCGSCAKLDANIKENLANIPSDVLVFNADWDDNQDLAAEYDVAKYHTVSFLNKDGGVDKNVPGLFEIDALVEEFAL